MQHDVNHFVLNLADQDLVRSCLLAVIKGEPLSPGELSDLGVKIPERKLFLEEFLLGNMVRFVNTGLVGDVEFPPWDEMTSSRRNQARRWFVQNAADCAKECTAYFPEYVAFINGDDQPALRLFSRSE